MAKKEVIMTKFKDIIDAIGISMKDWLNGMLFEKMSLMTLMRSLRSFRQNNKEMKPL